MGSYLFLTFDFPLLGNVVLTPLTLYIGLPRLENILSHLRHLTLRIVQGHDDFSRNCVTWVLHCLSAIPPANQLETFRLRCQLQPNCMHSFQAPPWRALDPLLSQASRFGKLSKVLIDVSPDPRFGLHAIPSHGTVASALRGHFRGLEAKEILYITESSPSARPFVVFD